ncbi:MAG TPA: hypothetical protein VF458_22480 [Ktedonobacteraceae bacterium]
MVVDVALYTLVHQPRRLKLPAQPIPRYASIEDITRCLFDERLNAHYFHQAARASYYPGARMFLNLVREYGLRLALGFSLSFVRQAELWEPGLLDLLRELVAEEGVELVGVDPYHSLHCLIDLPAFALRMNWMAGELERLFGKRPAVTDTTEMCISASIYDALDAAGFRGALIDGHPSIMQWRSSNYLYQYGNEQANPFELKAPTRPRRSARNAGRDRQGPPYLSETFNAEGLFLLARHRELSADVAQHFARHAWAGSPLYADTYARWIAQAAGDFALLNWDFETLGERHPQETGIFEFIQALPGQLKQQGVELRTPGEIIDRHAAEHTYHLPLPVHPPTWSETLGLESGFAREPQRELFQLLRDTYSLARLTEQPELLDLAIWLAQADNFRFLQEPGYQSSVPLNWWQPGPAEIAREQKQVYLNALHALEVYLPTRLLRQAQPASVAPRKPVRRKATAELPKDSAEEASAAPTRTRTARKSRATASAESAAFVARPKKRAPKPPE